MTESRSLIITGMHRSGTSLVASLLGRAGVDLGQDLLGPAVGNPRGHFEDRQFLDLQQGWLDRVGLDILVRHASQLPKLGTEDLEAARALVEARSEKALWGFKDPRTVLFLDTWATLLPDARYLFVYRHPLDVALSLDRRGSDLAAVADTRVSLRAWEVYNQALLAFATAHRDRCFVCDVEAVVCDVQGFVARVEDRLGLTLEAPEDLPSLFEREELHRATAGPHVASLLETLAPEVAELYGTLAATADLALDASGTSTPGPSSEAPGEARRRGLRQLADWLPPELVSERTFRPLLSLVMGLLDPNESDAMETALASHLGSFESHRRHARNLESMLDELEANLADAQARTWGLEHELAARQEALDATGVAQQTHQRQVAELETRLGEVTGDREALASHAVNLEHRISQISQDLESLSEYSARLEGEIGDRSKDQDGLRQELAQSREYLESVERHASNLDHLAQERLRRIEELEKHGENLETELSASRERIDALDQHTANLESLREGLEEELATARRELSPAIDSDALLAPHRTRIAELEQHVANLEEQAKTSEVEQRRTCSRVEELETHVGNLEAERDSAHRRIDELETHAENLETERDTAHRRIEELEAHVANVETLRAGLERHANNLESLRQGLEDRVGELERHAANLEQMVEGRRGDGVEGSVPAEH